MFEKFDLMHFRPCPVDFEEMASNILLLFEKSKNTFISNWESVTGSVLLR